MKLKLAGLFFAAALLAGCSTVESRISGHRAAFDTWPPAVRQKVAAGQIDVGFTMEQVQVALGDPDSRFARVSTTGSYEVWGYRRRGPQFGIGLGMGSFHGGSGYSAGVATTTGGRGEHLQVIFDQTGRVSSIEHTIR